MLYGMTENDLKRVVGGNDGYRCGRLVKNIFDGLRVSLVLTCGIGMMYGLMHNQGNLGNAVNVNVRNNVNFGNNVMRFAKLFALGATCCFLGNTILDVIETSYLGCEDVAWLPQSSDVALGKGQDL